jgi:hypothetical protein
VYDSIPAQNPDPELQPHTILDRRMVKHKNQAVTQVLVHWKTLSSNEATWEFADDLLMRYPQFFLKDKEIFKGEGIVASQNTQ